MSAYPVPPIRLGPGGRERRVGLEVEFARVDPRQVAEAIAALLDGKVDAKQPHVARALTALGEFRVELGAAPIKERRYVDVAEALGVVRDGTSTARWLDEQVAQVSRAVVPTEVVTPPIPISQLHQLDPLWSRLRDLGATGTRGSALYAFGLHINPEVPSTSAPSILAFIRAFLLLYDWLMDEGDVDPSRRLTPFILPFPENYRRRVLQADYEPDRIQLVADYLEDNPTRNRPLDMLPLFRHLEPELVESTIDDTEAINSRPTYHYRLPNSEIGVADWSPRSAWTRWCAVEGLADDPARLRKAAEAYLDLGRKPLRWQSREWVEQVEAWLISPPV